MLNEDQTVNRRRLAAVIFRDALARKRLEQIVHPPVLRAITQRVHRVRRERRVRAVVLDVPLLIEVKAQGLVDVLVVVKAPSGTQLERLRQKYGGSEEELSRRIAAQRELSAKVALADHVVDNSNGVEVTRAQVRRIWQQVTSRNKRTKKSSSTSRP